MESNNLLRALEALRHSRKYAKTADTDSGLAEKIVVEATYDLLEVIAEHLLNNNEIARGQDRPQWHYAPQYFRPDGRLKDELVGRNIPVNVTNDPRGGAPVYKPEPELF